MALLFLAVGLNFSGVFEMGLGLTRIGGAGEARRMAGGSLLTGPSGLAAPSTAKASLLGQ
jgi:thiol:disulfide interchange protein